MLQALLRSSGKNTTKFIFNRSGSSSSTFAYRSFSSNKPTNVDNDATTEDDKIYTLEEAMILKAASEKSSDEWLIKDSLDNIESHLNVVNKRLSEFYTPKKQSIEIEVQKHTVVPIINKCRNLIHQAETFLETRDLDRAESLLLGAQSLFNKSRSEIEATSAQAEYPHNLVYAYILSNLAFIFHGRNQYESARVNYEDSIRLLDNETDNQFFGSTLLNYAELLSSTDKADEAIKACQKAIKLFDSSKSKTTDERVYFAHHNLSSMYCQQDRLSEALKHSKIAFDGFSKSYGRVNNIVQTCAADLARIYDRLQMTAELKQLDALFAEDVEHTQIVQEMVDKCEIVTKDIDHINMVELGKTWADQGRTKAFDIEGFHKSSTTSRRQLGAFFREMDKQGVALGAETSDLLTNEINSVDYAADRLAQWQPRVYTSLPQHLQLPQQQQE